MSLASLADPALDAAFRTPTRLRVDSAWYGHVPFGQWIAAALEPRLLVELGTHAGVSYSAFCESVLAARLPTRGIAVDTWRGDEHAGFYDESVWEDWRRFHDQRYAGFSTLIRATFDEALPHVADGSVDLLHIDGRHRYEDVTHDWESWRPKLSGRGVVLFHDIDVHDGDFGVWRLWETLSRSHPSFAFVHAHGLGVLAPGAEVPEALAPLFDPGTAAALRERFALLGERWVQANAQADAEALRPERERLAAEVNRLYPIIEDLFGKNRDARVALATARYAEAAQAARLRGMERALDGAREDLAEARADAAQLRRAMGEVLGSRSWRVGWKATTLAARLLRRPAAVPPVVPGPVAVAIPALVPAAGPDPEAVEQPDRLPPLATERMTQPADPEPPPGRLTPPPAPEPRAARPTRPRRLLFLSGEPHTPGHAYRVLRPLALARRLGWEARWSDVAPVGPAELAGVGVLVMWRCPISPHLAGIVQLARAQGTAIVFDVDDLMFRPELATVEIIDGIRSQNFSESETSNFFGDIQRAIRQADLVTTTTAELAAQLRAIGADAMVLRNGFDEATLWQARHARRRWRDCADGCLRLGYAGGSRTHQRDFGEAAAAVATLLREREEARLVLFRAPGAQPLLDVEEFPALAGLEHRIEWREMVPIEALPDEIARFDINLAPLQHGNPFCEAKSELKYFEAVIAGVPTVASPTGPFRRAIEDGVTGLLASDEAGWTEALRRLAADPALRARLAREALHDVIWNFGPARLAEGWRSLLDQLDGADRAARAFELDLRRGGLRPRGRPRVPEAETLFAQDAGGQATVSVIIPLYNYQDYVVEALESVRAQTLSPLDLVIVDDRSTDESALTAERWLRAHAGRFNRALLLRHAENAGLGFARNSGFAAAETSWILPLDADNRLLPEACAALQARAAVSTAAFAYPAIRSFGDSDEVFGGQEFSALRLVRGNFIDAMALIAKWAWAAAGGYDHVRYGWEDYDFWCRLVEMGLHGLAVPEVLAEYRVHGRSMLRVTTERRGHKQALIADLRRRHPWLDASADLRLPEHGA